MLETAAVLLGLWLTGVLHGDSWLWATFALVLVGLIRVTWRLSSR